jgi:hypothetical protein
MTRIGFLLGLMACVALPFAAGAQNPQPAPPHETAPPVTPPGASQPVPEKIVPPADEAAKRRNDDNLSERLARQHGTVQPPTVDPGIQAPLPSRTQDTMPVIPPPGTPGGNQSVVPK